MDAILDDLQKVYALNQNQSCTVEELNL